MGIFSDHLSPSSPSREGHRSSVYRCPNLFTFNKWEYVYTHTHISTHNVFREGIYVLNMSIALLLPVETVRFCLSSTVNQIQVV